MSEVQFFEVSAEEQEQRLDNFLSSRLKGVPKSMLYRIIRKGEVRVNKGRSKPDRRLQAGDVVRVPPIRVAQRSSRAVPSSQLVELLQNNILYDESGLLVVNKPAGLAVHGGSGVKLGLIEVLRQAEGHPPFLELVHRLDKDTSGCILIARKRSVLKYLQANLREKGTIEKKYHLLVNGNWPAAIKKVDAPLLRQLRPSGERFVKVSEEGKASVTRFKVLERFESATLVEAFPLTGRTHQIRVHAKHAGHPLLGDEKYGNDDVNLRMSENGLRRLFLHAYSLAFEMPEIGKLYFEAPLPEELNRCLNVLRDGD